MPLMSVFISFGVPAAIGVYWIFKSILGTLKQFILHKAMPLPKFTEEDYKAAEREVGIRGKGKSKVNHAVKTALEEANTPAVKSKHAGAVRSLHHIDDEDFPDTAEAARIRREKLEAQEKEEAEKKAKPTGSEKSGLMAGVSLKKDDERKSGKKDKKTEESEKTDSSEDNDNKKD
jgi:membrane protein insertase Oxa1/YidC/SpoIIIJ